MWYVCISATREGNLVIFDNMGRHWGHMLSEMWNGKRQMACDWSYLYMESKIKQTNKQNPKSQIQNRLVVVRNKGLGWADCLKVVKKYKLPIIKEISPGDVTYIMVTIINSTILHIWKLQRELTLKVFITRKKCNCVCWWMLTKLIAVIMIYTYTKSLCFKTLNQCNVRCQLYLKFF